MSALVLSTQQGGAVLDMSTDGSGRYSATGAEDGTVVVYEMRGTTSAVVVSSSSSSGTSSSSNSSRGQATMIPIATLRAHETAVIRVAWAPSRCDGLPLATSSIEGQVHVWKEVEPDASTTNTNTNTSNKGGGRSSSKEWAVAYSKRFPAPVVGMAWSPEEFGIALACACADGKVYVLDNTARTMWNVAAFDAHTTCGCTGVSWCPYLSPGALLSMPLVPQRGPNGQLAAPPPAAAAPIPRIVTCGNEAVLRMWRYSRAEQMWIHEGDLADAPAATHRDVAWAPSIGLPCAYIAAASDDGLVTVWTQDGLHGPLLSANGGEGGALGGGGAWRAVTLPPFSDAVVKVSWSMVGSFLLVACADNSASLWKEDAQGGWTQVSEIEATVPLLPPHQRPTSLWGGGVPQNSNASNVNGGANMQQQQQPPPPPPQHSLQPHNPNSAQYTNANNNSSGVLYANTGNSSAGPSPYPAPTSSSLYFQPPPPHHQQQHFRNTSAGPPPPPLPPHPAPATTATNTNGMMVGAPPPPPLSANSPPPNSFSPQYQYGYMAPSAAAGNTVPRVSSSVSASPAVLGGINNNTNNNAQMNNRGGSSHPPVMMMVPSPPSQQLQPNMQQGQPNMHMYQPSTYGRAAY